MCASCFRLTEMVRSLVLVVWLSAGLFAQSGEFDAASIKPSAAQGNRASMRSDGGRLTYTNVTLRDCLMSAYGVKDYQVSGPEWMRTDRYDIVATAPAAVDEDALKLMLQKLLNARFQMTVHREKRDLPVYAMVVSKSGAKLHDAAAPGRPNMRMNGGGVSFTSVTITDLIDLMTRAHLAELDRPVVDNTGLKGQYDISVNLFASQDDLMAAMAKGDFGSSIFTLIQEQLGLKLEPQKMLLDMVIVDKAERTPTAN